MGGMRANTANYTFAYAGMLKMAQRNLAESPESRGHYTSSCRTRSSFQRSVVDPS